MKKVKKSLSNIAQLLLRSRQNSKLVTLHVMATFQHLYNSLKGLGLQYMYIYVRVEKCKECNAKRDNTTDHDWLRYSGNCKRE